MKKWIFYILPFTMLGLMTCNKTVEPDPCGNAKPTRADFDVYEAFGGSPSLSGILDTDSIFFNQIGQTACTFTDSTYTTKTWSELNLYFRAKDTTANSYRWTFSGSEQIFTSVGFSLRFIPDKTPREVAVTLIISKKAGYNTCFTKDNGIDTISKVFRFFKLRENNIHRMEGNYRGVLKSNYLYGSVGRDSKPFPIPQNSPMPDETFDITIERVGYIQFWGKEIYENPLTLSCRAGQDPVFCDYSIDNFGWLQCKEVLHKACNRKRNSVYLGTSNFFGYNIDIKGTYNAKKRELIIIGDYVIDSLNLYQSGIAKNISNSSIYSAVSYTHKFSFTYTGYKLQ